MELHRKLLVKEFTKCSLMSFAGGKELFDFCWKHVQAHRQEEFDKVLANFPKPAGNVSEAQFTKEFVWCVLVSGFKANRVAAVFPQVLRSHQIEDREGNFLTATGNLLEDRQLPQVYAVWANQLKAKAIRRLREMIAELGWEQFRLKYLEAADPLKIAKLPFMGPALRNHLARNLGNLQVVKPDVHLNRLAYRYGYKDAQEMCEKVSNFAPGLNDLVLWFASIDHGTKS